MSARPRKPRIETAPGKKKRQEEVEKTLDVRLNKFLADPGITSIRGARELISPCWGKVRRQHVT